MLEGIFSEELTGSFWLVLLGMPKKMGVQVIIFRSTILPFIQDTCRMDPVYWCV